MDQARIILSTVRARTHSVLDSDEERGFQRTKKRLSNKEENKTDIVSLINTNIKIIDSKLLL